MGKNKTMKPHLGLLGVLMLGFPQPSIASRPMALDNRCDSMALRLSTDVTADVWFKRCEAILREPLKLSQAKLALNVLKQRGGPYNAAEQQHALKVGFPLSRLVRGALLLLDSKVVGGLPTGRSLYFSTNESKHTLSRKKVKLLYERYRRDLQVWDEADDNAKQHGVTSGAARGIHSNLGIKIERVRNGVIVRMEMSGKRTGKERFDDGITFTEFPQEFGRSFHTQIARIE